MYEIVANKLNAIDVDKMEYFARDCHGLGIRNTFDHLRFISQCRVMFPNDSDNTTIAVRDKEKLNLYELFHTRNGLFRRAYQHPGTHGIQLMIADALVEANEHLLFPTKDEEKITKIKMSDAWKDMSVYEKLTDSVVDLILMREDEKGMKKAKDLIHRIYKRQLYRLVGQTDPETNVTKEKLSDIENDLQDEELFTKDDSKNDTERITKDDFQVQKLTFSYGMKKENPITSVYFYKKGSFECFPGGEPTKTSLFLPSGNVQEEIVLVYSTSLNKNKTDKLSRKWDDLKKNEDAKKAMK
ncbi:deoxynucleoside triphosphate triphosphohydrolase SAMHD1-like isoform X2 [Mytilus edulis]|uniref:deoxynucleoside triphosphate triphosphohydrolase SAMHD1-like isoform X2 n=1 Tax=Mytilus edulis TaxID=6550 RepID=UPI0039EF35D9